MPGLWSQLFLVKKLSRNNCGVILREFNIILSSPHIHDVCAYYLGIYLGEEKCCVPRWFCINTHSAVRRLKVNTKKHTYYFHYNMRAKYCIPVYCGTHGVILMVGEANKDACPTSPMFPRYSNFSRTLQNPTPNSIAEELRPPAPNWRVRNQNRRIRARFRACSQQFHSSGHFRVRCLFAPLTSPCRLMMMQICFLSETHPRVAALVPRHIVSSAIRAFFAYTAISVGVVVSIYYAG